MRNSFSWWFVGRCTVGKPACGFGSDEEIVSGSCEEALHLIMIELKPAQCGVSLHTTPLTNLKIELRMGVLVYTVEMRGGALC